MSKPVCEACGGIIENPKSVVILPDFVILCLSCYESERQSTPSLGVDYEDNDPYERVSDLGDYGE